MVSSGNAFVSGSTDRFVLLMCEQQRRWFNNRGRVCEQGKSTFTSTDCRAMQTASLSTASVTAIVKRCSTEAQPKGRRKIVDVVLPGLVLDRLLSWKARRGSLTSSGASSCVWQKTARETVTVVLHAALGAVGRPGEEAQQAAG